MLLSILLSLLLSTQERLTPRANDDAPACTKGEHPSNVDPTLWSGKDGYVRRYSGERVFLYERLIGGPLCSSCAHQTLVGPGIDPAVGISTVAPRGSGHSIRVGNADVNAYTELLSKTFVATHDAFRFAYALVFQDPEHDPHQQPRFEIRASADGEAIPVDLGDGDFGMDGLGVLIADDLNPVLLRKPNSRTLYRDWTPVTIDLSDHIGKTITVEFITSDCSLGGHFAYAYIDDFCVTGSCATLLPATPRPECEPCGAGTICFDYSIVTAGGAPGSGRIELDLLQNGAVKTTLANDVSGSGTSCFAITDAILAALDGADGFDYVVRATFAAPIGSAPAGVAAGLNDDYRIACGTRGCCPGFNATTNGDFESGSTGFTSDYSPGVLPGQYAVLTASEAAAVAVTWSAKSHDECDDAHHFLAVNGATGGTKRLVWSQTSAVVPGAEYRFCANFRNLPQRAFDVKPRVEIRFSPSIAFATAVIDRDASNTCDWHRETLELRIPSDTTSLRAEIWLDESAPGDGNDLAIDQISLQRRPAAATAPANVIRTDENECIPP